METSLHKSLLFILILCCSSKLFAQEEFTSTQIKKYKKGIFEVVTLKLEDKTLYKDEFPHDLIPFQIRNDKYHSVGTAFLIDDKTFVSAAHVFSVGYDSLLADNYALRDAKGNIFEILNVEKYSNYRDLIQFTVKQSTDSYHTFDIATDYEEGDTIYAAGNALGEGVIFRKGTLTSFTYEPINGQWKDIRFSAAASPGNSGGPLLNLKGEVLGIVTKKSDNENLNYALPIQEHVAFTTESAEFFDKQIGEVESGKRLMYGWQHNIPLPKPILELRKLAEDNFYNRFVSGRKEFLKKYATDLFPLNENVDKYLKNQSNNTMLSMIDVNGNGEWLLYEASDIKKIKIDNNQSIWFGANDKFLGNYQFYLEKPEDIALVDFVNNPKLVLDTFMTSVKWNRPIANTPVYIESYGDPFLSEKHTDKYGRVWSLHAWRDHYSDQTIMTYCLPIPAGITCDLAITSASWFRVQKSGYVENLHRIMLSYTGQLKEWEAFLALPKTQLPRFFIDAKVELKDEKFQLQAGEFSANLSNIGLDKNSELYLSVVINPDDVSELVADYFSLQPNINEENRYSVSKFYDLKENASDSYTDFWNKYKKQESPYNFEIIDEGEVISKKLNLVEYTKMQNGSVNIAEDVGYLATCENESKLGSETLAKNCDAFISGLNKL